MTPPYNSKRCYDMSIYIVISDKEEGFPQDLSEDALNSTLLVLHKHNDKTKHPFQEPAIGHQQFVSDADASTHSSPISIRSGSMSLPRQQQVSATGHPASLSQVSSQEPNTQEVTQYCMIEGCNWHSYETTDRNLLSTCFQMLTLHLKMAHDISDPTSDTPPSVQKVDKASR